MEPTGRQGVGDRLRKLLPLLPLPLLCLGVYLFWAYRLPMAMAPDESMRYLIPRYIFEHGVLPFGDEPEILDVGYGTSYGFQPYGSSLLAVPLMWMAARLSSSPVALVFAARCASALCGALAVFVSELIGRRVFRHPLSPYLMGALVGLLPQFAFASSYLNKDAYAVCACALVVHAWLLGVERRWSLGACAWLGFCLGVLVLGYYQAFGFLLASILAFAATWLRSQGEAAGDARRGWRVCARAVLVVFLVAMVVGGWHYVRNIVLHGDMRGVAASHALRDRYGTGNFRLERVDTPRAQGIGLLEMVLSPHGAVGKSWLESSLESFVGCFGYMAVWLDDGLYLAYGLIVCLGLGLRLLLARRSDYPALSGLRVPLALASAVDVAITLYYSYTVDWSPQGRYLFPCLVPLALCVAGGYDALASRLALGARSEAGTNAPVESRGGTACIVAALSLVATLFAYVFVTTAVPNCMQGIATPAENVPAGYAGNNDRIFGSAAASGRSVMPLAREATGRLDMGAPL